MDKMNSKNDLITLPIGKILIVRKNGKKEFLKVNEDNTVRELNKEETEYINNIFYAPKESIIYSQTAMEIASTNENFNGDNAAFLPTMKLIEEFIPEEAREKLYKNLKTLKIEWAEPGKLPLGDTFTKGYYDCKENKIKMSPEYLAYLKGLEEKGELEDYKSTFSRDVIHEMLHMASSSHNLEDETMNIGFDKFYDDGKPISSNRGITEGLTEVYADKLVKQLTGKPAQEAVKTGYSKEKLIAKQLQMLCPDELRSDYFKGNGCEALKNKMQEYYNGDEFDADEAEQLFEKIEDGYNLSKCENEEGFKSTIPLRVQNSLLNALENKMEKDIQNGTIKSREEVDEYLEIYGKNILTPENLGLGDNDKDKFPGLEDMIPSRFEGIKDKYKERVSERNITTPQIENNIQSEVKTPPILDKIETSAPEVSTNTQSNITLNQIEKATQNVPMSNVSQENAVTAPVLEPPAPAVDVPAIE